MVQKQHRQTRQSADDAGAGSTGTFCWLTIIKIPARNEEVLERRGYDITVAHSADQATEKARTQEFDLLISDIGLPDRSGYELMREVRLNKRLPGIALSGFGSEQDVNQAREAGFAEHLTKPINFERLEKTIQSLLS